MPWRLSRSPSGVTKSKAPPESCQAAVAAARSGKIKVCPNRRCSSGCTDGSASITLAAPTALPRTRPAAWLSGNGCASPGEVANCNAATLARPVLLPRKSSKICRAASGCSVRTSCRWWPRAVSIATTYWSGTRILSASEPSTLAAVLRAERAPEPKPSCSACNCSSKLRRERFSACCRRRSSNCCVVSFNCC